MDELIAALKEQTKMIGQLVESVCLLVDSIELPEQQEQDGNDQPQYLLDGTRIS